MNVTAILVPTVTADACVLDVVRAALAQHLVPCFEIAHGRWGFFPPDHVPAGWSRFAAIVKEAA